MKTIEVKSIQDVIQFLTGYVIECNPEDNCGRCDDGRECVKFLSQFKSEPLPEISEQEIDKEFPITSETTTLTLGYIKENTAKREGARWYRSELRKRGEGHVTMHDLRNDIETDALGNCYSDADSGL